MFIAATKGATFRLHQPWIVCTDLLCLRTGFAVLQFAESPMSCCGFFTQQVQWFELVLFPLQVHLLNDERGPVIETLIARTQRQVNFGSCLFCEKLCMSSWQQHTPEIWTFGHCQCTSASLKAAACDVKTTISMCKICLQCCAMPEHCFSIPACRSAVTQQ